MTGARSKQDKQMMAATTTDPSASQRDGPLAVNQATAFDQTKLQFFYENGQVAGFGWLNDNHFCIGSYLD